MYYIYTGPCRAHTHVSMHTHVHSHEFDAKLHPAAGTLIERLDVFRSVEAHLNCYCSQMYLAPG